MQELLHEAMTWLEYFASPALIKNSARAILATTATFSGSRHRREAALRALRAFNGQHDDHERRDDP